MTSNMFNFVKDFFENIEKENISDTEALHRFKNFKKEIAKFSNQSVPDHLIIDDAPDTAFENLQSQYTELQRKFEEYRILNAPQISEIEKEVSFSKFRDLVAKKIGCVSGGEKGWQKYFQDGTGGKYDWSHLTKWRRNNKVPVEVLADVENMDISKINARSPIRWSDDEIEALKSYTHVDADGYVRLNEGHKIITVANDLTQKFGRYITDGSVKSKLNGLRKKENMK